MKTKSEIVELWTCPKCGRQFERQGQSHSCRVFPIEQHFERKPKGKQLYETFKNAVEKEIGPFKVESLECCIHFVSTFTFAAVKIFKEKIRVDFSLNRKIDIEPNGQLFQMSAHRFLYAFDITKKGEIDKQLMGYIKEALEKKSGKAETN